MKIDEKLEAVCVPRRGAGDGAGAGAAGGGGAALRPERAQKEWRGARG